MSSKNGFLVVSLDFELFWGVADFAAINDWKEIIDKVHTVVPEILNLFQKYGIHATWATVGGILAENKEDFQTYLTKPINAQTIEIINYLWKDSLETSCPDSMLFAPGLVKKISNTPGQELGSHTYSHYYCSKENSDPRDFQNELWFSMNIFEQKGYGVPRTIVFPRNQVGDKYTEVIPSKMSIYRGVENGTVTRIKRKYPFVGTILWYIDHYLPIRKSRNYDIESCVEGKRINIRQSRFFKAYKARYAFFEPLKIKRYKREMLDAAKKNQIYHICWHPHNFSQNMENNLKQIEELFRYYEFLKSTYNFESLSMGEVEDRIVDLNLIK